jgi:NitT/TauT family transport system permease protein
VKRLRLPLVIVVVAALWEIGRRLFGVSPLVMPGIVDILRALATAIWSGDILAQLGFSFSLIGTGMAVAVILALAATVAGAGSRVVSNALAALASLLHPLPGIALLPVVILWFGTGRAAIVVIIVHSVFWPLFTNLQTGYENIPATYRLVGRNLGMSTVTFATRIAAPATVPYMVAGLRIAWARSWRALISAEMVFGAVAAQGGLGWFLHTRRVFMDTAGLFAGIVVVMIVGSLVEQIVLGAVERATIRRWGGSH